MENLLNTSMVYRTHATSRPGRAEIALEDHKKIYDLLCQRDAASLIPFLEKHVSRAFSKGDEK